MKRLVGAIVALAVASCATVRDDDLRSWEGQPVSALEKHPVFITMPVVRARASDGTQIWNYVNGRGVSSCTANAMANSFTVSMATYSQFTQCMQTFAACNNIFYVKNGIVERYTAIGSGGMRCYTDVRVRPGAASPTNYR
jgi:hypothetical protein